jgi:hypothetical protein
MQVLGRPSLTEVMMLDGVDTLRVSDGVHGPNALPFTHPFVFTPSHKMDVLKQDGLEMEMQWDDPSPYEGLLDEVRTPPTPENNPMGLPWMGVAWDMRSETWDEFETNIDVAFKSYKKAYKQRMEAYMKQLDFTVSIKKRNLDHFEWFVRYQLQGWSMRKIADDYSKTSGKLVVEDTVSKALHSVSDTVLLPLRTPK